MPFSPALQKLRGISEVDQELEDLENEEGLFNKRTRTWTWSVCDVLRTKTLRLPLLLACAVNLTAQLTAMGNVSCAAGNLLTNLKLDDYVLQWSILAVSIITVTIAALAV